MLIDAPMTLWGGGAEAVWDNAKTIVSSCWTGLLAAGLFAIVEFVSRRGKREAVAQHRDQLWLLGWWIAPMLAFGIVVYTFRPDNVLSYFPALAVLAGTLISRSWLIAGIVGMVNCAAFLGSLPVVLGLPVTATEIREHDRRFGACVTAIRERYRPEEVVICHANQYFLWGFRQFQYHLPAYENFLLRRDPALASPFDSKLWSATGLDLRFVEELPPHKTLLLIVPPRLSTNIFENLIDASRSAQFILAEQNTRTTKP